MGQKLLIVESCKGKNNWKVLGKDFIVRFQLLDTSGI